MSLKNRTPGAALKAQRQIAIQEENRPSFTTTNKLQKRHYAALKKSEAPARELGDKFVYEKEINLITKLRKLAQQRAPAYQTKGSMSVQQEYMGLRDEILRIAHTLDSHQPTLQRDHQPLQALSTIEPTGEIMLTDQSPKLIRLNPSYQPECGIEEQASSKDAQIPRLHNAPSNLDSYKELIRHEETEQFRLSHKPVPVDFAAAAAELIQDRFLDNDEPKDESKLTLSLLDLT